MSNIIPPLISNSPPPMHVNSIADDEEEDDEEDDFGNFASANDITNCSCDGLSLPQTPESTPQKLPIITDVNCNSKNKDYQDKRKANDSPTTEENFYYEEPPELIFDNSKDSDDSLDFQDLSVPSLVNDDDLNLPKLNIPYCNEDENAYGDDSKDDITTTDHFQELNEEVKCDDIKDTIIIDDKLDEDTDCDPTQETQDDFGDFADFTANAEKVSNDVTVNDYDDDFDDFKSHTEESSSTASPVCVLPDFNPIKIQEVIDEMFPPIENEIVINEAVVQDFIMDDCLFGQMKDITETMAVCYIWNKSSSQSALLKSLNIDMRNILHGLGWNASVPKFAATLSTAPLEPLRSDILIPQQQSSSTTITSDIPRAQFDWTSAGLTNPLDYLESLVPSLDIPPSNISQSPIQNDLDNVWDYWLQSDGNTSPGIKPDTESVKSLHFPETDEQAEKDDYKEFVGFEPQPLRESHISDSTTNSEGRINDVEDDFSDFQMSLPVAANKPKEILQPMVLQPQVVASAQINWPDPGLSDADLINIEQSLCCLKPLNNTVSGEIEAEIEAKVVNNKNAITKLKSKDEDDDWSDFVSNQDVAKPKNVYERTSTPELQLSIPQLNNIHPPKQPIPVITPHGLLQTKIPTMNHATPHSITQSIYPSLMNHQQNQPSIISQQFARQNNIIPSSKLQSSNQTQYNEDDWTDFISSQPSSATATTMHNKTQMNNWNVTHATTNIISNPLSAYNRTRNNLLLPDLEFSNAPKTKMKQ